MVRNSEAMRKTKVISNKTLRNMRDNFEWYVVQVNVGRELQACNQLGKVVRGFDTSGGGSSHLSDLLDEWFVPLYRVATSRKGVVQEATEVLYPGYIIVSTADVDALKTALEKMPAFARILGSNNEAYLPLSEEERAWINAFTKRDDRIIDKSLGYIEKGEVRVVDGPLVGREAQIVKINRRKGIAVIRLTMCGREVETKIGLNVVRQDRARGRHSESI